MVLCAGSTALHIAVCDNHLDIVKLLVDNNADMDFQDRWNNSSYDEAVKAGHTHIIEYLDGVRAKRALEGNRLVIGKGVTLALVTQVRQTPFTRKGVRSKYANAGSNR